MCALLSVLIALQRGCGGSLAFALLSSLSLFVNVGQDKEALLPLFIYFSFPFLASLSDDQAGHQRRDREMTRRSVVFTPRTRPRSINSDASTV